MSMGDDELASDEDELADDGNEEISPGEVEGMCAVSHSEHYIFFSNCHYIAIQATLGSTLEDLEVARAAITAAAIAATASAAAAGVTTTATTAAATTPSSDVPKCR